jgi:hypothetical protein
MMITSEEYQRALRHAAEQTGPVVADIICRWCGGRRIGTVSRRPRGLYLVSVVEEMEILGIELILRVHAQGKSWKHLVPSEMTEEQVERIIALVTRQPDYKPRTERITPAHQRWHALLDLFPDGLPDNRYQVTVGCPVHGRINFDSRQLRDAISQARKRIRFVVPLQT